MDFAILDKAFRVKTKTSSLVIDPPENSKIEADAALFSVGKTPAKGARLSVTGPGEYEVGGVKISASSMGGTLFFQLEADNLRVGLGKMSQMKNNQEKLPSCQVVAVNADSTINMESIIGTESSVIVVYGENAQEAEKLAGNVAKTSKFSVTFEKLPQETQTVVIG